MNKLKSLTRWEAMLCLLLIPAVVLMGALIFLTPPPLDQYDWVRAQDLDKAVQQFQLTIVDSTLQEVTYVVKTASGQMEQVRCPTKGQEFSVMPDTRTKESASLLTFAQAKTLVTPLWDFAASMGDWDLLYLNFGAPSSIRDSLSKLKVDATLSVSTGKLTVVDQMQVTESNFGYINLSAMDKELTGSFGARVLIVP